MEDNAQAREKLYRRLRTKRKKAKKKMGKRGKG